MKIGYLLVGVPGAGKSTYIKKLVKDIPAEDVGIFSLDTVRVKMYAREMAVPMDEASYADAFEFAMVNSKKFDEAVTAEWQEVLGKKFVIVDNTNLVRKARARWINDLMAKKFKVIGVQIDVPLQVAIDRQQTRGDKCVPENIVRDMYFRSQELMWDEVDEIVNVKGM